MRDGSGSCRVALVPGEPVPRLRMPRIAALVLALPPFGVAASFAATPFGAPEGVGALTSFTAAGFQTSRTLRPGDPRVEVYRLVVVNPNVLVGSDQIAEITFQNRNSSAGPVAQRDAEWQPLTLSASKRARDVLDPGTSTPLDTATFSSNSVRFSGLNLSLGPGDSMYVVIAGAPSVLARDAGTLDLRLSGASAIRLANGTGVVVAAGGTLDPAGSFPVDGMSAAQIQLLPVTDSYIPIGTTRRLALAFRVPPDGFADDRLQRLEVVNRGTASAGLDLTRMDAWLDDGDGVYVPGQEVALGPLAFTGASWILSGLSTDVLAPAGAWVFVTLDVSATARENETVRLAVPTFGIDMQSANDGPNDHEVGNPSQQVLTLDEHVVLSSQTLPMGIASPGASRRPLLALAVTNTYPVSRTLTGMTVTNATVGPGTVAERDGETDLLEIRLDGDGDGALDEPSVDPVLATAVFANGRAVFSGVSLPLPPGGKRLLFVTGDISLLKASDGDVVAASIAVREDVQFAEGGTAIAGGFPLGSGAGWTVDGMVASQIGNGGAPPRTLSSGDGPVEALDFLVHRNGYLDDVLQQVAVTQLGSAPVSDIAQVRLWRDGGDGAFDAGAGDDRDLGSMTPGGGVWSSGALYESLGASGARLFASVSISGTPTDSTTVVLGVPLGGLTMASGNDGPADRGVSNPDPLLLANRGLVASLGFGSSTATVGQTVTLTMTVRSTAPETLIAVAPAAPAFTGSATLTAISGPAPASRVLGPGASGTFVWTYSASAPGTKRASARATGTGKTSGNPYVSLEATSGELGVLSPADSVSLTAFDGMPQSVTRGQRGVLPLYLSFAHPDSVGSAARVTRIRLRLEREDGSDVVPSSLLSSVAIVSASDTLAVRTSLETSGASVDLPLTTPALVAPGAPITIAIALDVSSSTVVPDFRLVVPAETDVVAEDAATGTPVPVRLQSTLWPVRTGLARVLAAATRLDLAVAPLAPVRAGQGQSDVTLATFTLQSPGVTGVTTDVRVGAFDVRLADTTGVRLPRPGRFLARLKVRSGTQTLADRPVAPGADSTLALTLSPLLAVPVNTPIELRLVADVSDTASLGSFRLELGDSVRFDARDPNTGNRVPVLYASHPPTGPACTIESIADRVYARGLPQLPPSLGLGARGVPALTVVLRHPGGPGAGRLRVNALAVRCIDDAGVSLVPAVFLDRMQVLWNGALIASVPDPPAAGGTMQVTLPGPTLEPGDTAVVTFLLDFESAAPGSNFAIAVGASGLDIVDANRMIPALPVVENGGEFPLLSGVTRLVPPSRLLAVDLIDAMPAVLASDGFEVAAGTIRLVNGAAAGSGPVRVSGLTLAVRTASGPAAIGSAIGRVSLAVGGVPVGASAPLTADSLTATVAFPTELLIDPGAPVDLELRFATRTDPSIATFGLVLDAPGVGVVQPGSPLLDVSILPAPGRAFPLATMFATYAPASLAKSWSSFPNPFTPALGPARFAFYLERDSRVSLEIWTARGDRVVQVLDRQALAAGLHQDVVWDGRNGTGALVQSGVYVARLTVSGAGRAETLNRKVAVVR